MSRRGQIIKRFLLVIYLLAVHAFAGLFIYERFIAVYVRTDEAPIAGVNIPTEATPVPTPLPIPSIFPEENTNAVNINALEANTNAPSNQNQTPTSSDSLMIPVVGIKRADLLDTFSDSRSENRVHDAIDIIAPQGTPVVAVADGEIAKFFDSKLGGITIYQHSADKKFIYYYSHLQKRAENLKEKDFVRQGTVIGYVGDTGNAGAGNYHLHFSISVPSDPQRYWEGNYINPYPLLKNGIEAR